MQQVMSRQHGPACGTSSLKRGSGSGCIRRCTLQNSPYWTQHLFTNTKRGAGVCSASSPGDQSEGGRAGSQPSELDWDRAWSTFTEKLCENVPEVEECRVEWDAAKPPRFGPGSSRWNSSAQADALRAQERAYVQFWNSPLFFAVGGAITALLLVTLLSVAGGAPHDPRCTLPWC